MAPSADIRQMFVRPFGIILSFLLASGGILNAHGVSMERIIPGKLIVNSDSVVIMATVSVPLKEHAINVPKLLSQKIAEGIFVQVEISLEKVQ